MKRPLINISIALFLSCHMHAQEKSNNTWDHIKQSTTLGGYVIGKAEVTDQDISETNKSYTNFDLRLVRLYAGGKLGDFKYNLQLEINGVSGSTKEKGPRIVDAWAEWTKYKFINVKFGQFKRGFTFENPMHPWDVGLGAYSQLIDKLAGMNDRVGEHTSGGRDIGLQLQGNLFESANKEYSFLHYQLGVFNGQGINHADENKAKDIVGGVWYSPIKSLNIGAFGWSGNYTAKSTDVNKKITVDRNRISFGLKYESSWSFRAEYAISEGHKISDYKQDDKGQLYTIGNGKSDAWYVAAGVPITSQCKIYGKWDVYRDEKTNQTQKSIYGISANYYFYKNLKLQANYNYIEDNCSMNDKHYNAFDMQLYWRF